VNISKIIHPNDEMFNYLLGRLRTEKRAKTYYFASGKQLADSLIDFSRSISAEPSKLKVCEFAAGYGRVTRWLISFFEDIHISDLEIEMLNFHKHNFNTKVFQSSLDPNGFNLKHNTFDLIFVFSMFTHLPEKSWEKWLCNLYSMLKKNGHLIFSVHSYELFSKLNPQKYRDKSSWSKPFIFWSDNETNGRLSPDYYGCNITSRDFVMSKIKKLKSAKVIKHCLMGEFDRYHDIYIIQKLEI